jgi:eukaryotic-like serine/threonine-protein kinase
MQIDSADALIQALRASELFTRDQLDEIVRELAPLGDDPSALMRHLVARELVSLYLLKKIAQDRAADLRLGPYVITDKIGEGGMGKVYRGRRTSDGRVVALKIVRPKLLANPVIRKRYEREVATALTLKHQNIVEVFDAGETGGRYFIAMEFVDGIDLSRLMREYKPLEVAEACEYVRQAALGLHHAHEAGFVHRDIKPSNILVAGERHVPQATEPAVVKILDMGLVRAVLDDGGPMDDLTRAGTVVGTPDYMAPEQAKNSSTVDHRADLYSLGCTLYFALTGQPPFFGGTPIARILRHQTETPPPLQALRREVPTAVAEVVAKLLAKKPEQRFPNALAVAEVLDPLARYPRGSRPVPIRVRRSRAAALPVSDTTTTSGTGSLIGDSSDEAAAGPAERPRQRRVRGSRERARRRRRATRRAWLIVAAALVLLAVGVGLWVALHPWWKPPPAPAATR